MKMVRAAYLFAVLVVIAGFWLYFTYGENQPRWLLAIPWIAFLPPLKMHVTRRLVTLQLQDSTFALVDNLIFLARWFAIMRTRLGHQQQQCCCRIVDWDAASEIVEMEPICRSTRARSPFAISPAVVATEIAQSVLNGRR